MVSMINRFFCRFLFRHRTHHSAQIARFQQSKVIRHYCRCEANHYDITEHVGQPSKSRSSKHSRKHRAH